MIVKDFGSFSQPVIGTRRILVHTIKQSADCLAVIKLTN